MSNSVGKTCHYWNISAKITARLNYTVIYGRAETSAGDCVVNGCEQSKMTKCVLLYDFQNQICYRYDNAGEALESVNSGQIVKSYTDRILVARGAEDLTLPVPAGLWLFDDITRGRNLGYKGSSLDCVDEKSNEPNISGPFLWNDDGPQMAQSRLNFAKSIGSRDSFCISKFYKQNLSS